VLITNSSTAGRLAVSAPPITAAPAIRMNQPALAGEKRTSPSHTSLTSRCRTRRRARLDGSGGDACIS
jgi:hypothetical protein